jgi:phosphoglycolate phosphatase
MTDYFFDLDGVLTDSRPGLHASFRGALQALGLPDQRDDQLNRFLGTPLPEMFRALRRDVSESDIERGIAAFRRVYESAGIRQNHLYPGVLDMLRAIRQRQCTAWIVTSKPEKYAIEVARLLGIDGYLKGIVGAGLDEQDTKTGLIATALTRAAVPYDAAIMLGDRHYDVSGALANRVLPVGALWGYGSRDELAGAGCRHFVHSAREFEQQFVTGAPDVLASARRGMA